MGKKGTGNLNLVSAIIKKAVFIALISIAFIIANIGKLGVISVTTEMSVNSSMRVMEGDTSTVGGIVSHSISSGVEKILHILGYSAMVVLVFVLIFDIAVDAQKAAQATALQSLQNIENSRMIAEAEAQAIKEGRYRPVPSTVVVQDLNMLGTLAPGTISK